MSNNVWCDTPPQCAATICDEINDVLAARREAEREGWHLPSDLPQLVAIDGAPREYNFYFGSRCFRVELNAGVTAPVRSAKASEILIGRTDAVVFADLRPEDIRRVRVRRLSEPTDQGEKA